MSTLAAILLALMIVGPFIVLAFRSEDFFTPLPYGWCPVHYDEELDPDTHWCRLCNKTWNL